MQSYETPETIVHETQPETQAPAESTWTGDRPIYLTLAVSALASVAAVPVILAVYGPMATLKLLYPSLLAGLLVGMSGLLIAGLVTSGVRAVKAARGGQSVRAPRPTGKLRGKLALG